MVDFNLWVLVHAVIVDINDSLGSLIERHEVFAPGDSVAYLIFSHFWRGGWGDPTKLKPKLVGALLRLLLSVTGSEKAKNPHLIKLVRLVTAPMFQQGRNCPQHHHEHAPEANVLNDRPYQQQAKKKKTANTHTAVQSITKTIRSSLSLRLALLFAAACLVTFRPTIIRTSSSSSPSRRSTLDSSLPSTTTSFGNGEGNDVGPCAVSFEKYEGEEYRNERDTVGKAECLLESKFMRVQRHKVRLPAARTDNTSNESVVVDDWIWIDHHDRINVLVEAPRNYSNSERGKGAEEEGDVDQEMEFYVFEQTKYALEGRTSLAIVGGIVEPGEQPEHAARREVEEEMAVTCDSHVHLGRYRTDVNRGMGWLNSYLAMDCSRVNMHGKKDGSIFDQPPKRDGAEEVGVPDAEQQDLQTIKMSDLREALLAGRFLEVQWTATISLALHYLDVRRAASAAAATNKNKRRGS